ncbi:fimbria/pilus outer membrane usher protein [Rhodanobacter sp. MP7CTX1]|uniref:fimbria/pilus outer membrane usher protein n=1 Tax=Rhodanobacter sp. MP7CTX1 TaxID=2723084 RepID=UPI0016076790|nr:fimbria/pilus outer membrane usher protein [Rhodanobacter sp. MP7CTX1]MBB6188682.1 outer membrane usher protein [Rhodanobacter sp. MP7CTX1]
MNTKHPVIAALRLTPLSAVLLALLAHSPLAAAASAAPASATADASAGPADVQFNSQFLHGQDSTPADISRFNKGNVALPGSYRADLYVNEIWLGRAEITLRDTGDGTVQACFNHDLLERAGVDLSKLSAEAQAALADGASGSACHSLPEWVPDATATFDNGEQRLDVSVPQIALNRQARGYVDPKYWDNGLPAVTLQYSGNIYHSDTVGHASTQAYMGLLAGINVDVWRLRYQSNVTHDPLGTHYQNIQTYVQRTLAPIKSQLTIGDTFTDGRIFDSYGIRGVNLASDDRMYPESQRGYAPTVRGIANTNAKVQIRQNGNIIYETTVAPGAFEINDLYPTGYGGDLDVIVTEADGSVHTSAVPYASTVDALRPGMMRYEAVAGEYNNGAPGNVTPFVSQFTLQRGLTNTVTAYGGVILADHYDSILLGAALNTRAGAFGLDVSQANSRFLDEPNRNGHSVRLSYSKLVSPTNTNISVAAYRYSSSGYLSLQDAVALRDASWLQQRSLPSQFGLQPGEQVLPGQVPNWADQVIALQQMGALYGTQKSRLQLNINQNLGNRFGSLYVAGTAQNYWNRRGINTQYQAGYNNQFKSITYGLSISRQYDITYSRWDTVLMANVNIPFGTSLHAPRSMTSYQHDAQSGADSIQESVTGVLGADNAFSYGITAGRYGAANGSGSGSSNSGGANVSYQAPFATVSATASKGTSYEQQGAGITGGIVAYGEGVSFTPILGETIGIVEAKDAAGARLTNASGLRVDGTGHAVVANLVPFSDNVIEIDPKGLPIGEEFKSTTQHIAPTAGAVVRVHFETDNTGRSAILHATRPDGQPLPFGADVTDGEGSSMGTVAQGNRVIVRGLKADSGELVVKWGGATSESCRLSYSLPPADKAVGSMARQMVEAVCR